MWGVIVSAVISVAQFLLPRLLAVLGVAVASESVLKPIISWLQSKIFGELNGLPADVTGFLQFVGVYDSILIVFSAYAMALGIKVGKAAFAKKAAG